MVGVTRPFHSKPGAATVNERNGDISTVELTGENDYMNEQVAHALIDAELRRLQKLSYSDLSALIGGLPEVLGAYRSVKSAALSVRTAGIKEVGLALCTPTRELIGLPMITTAPDEVQSSTAQSCTDHSGSCSCKGSRDNPIDVEARSC
jgi:hypothetical protein